MAWLGMEILDPVCSLAMLGCHDECGGGDRYIKKLLVVYGPTFTRSKKIPAPQPLSSPKDAMSCHENGP